MYTSQDIADDLADEASTLGLDDTPRDSRPAFPPMMGYEETPPAPKLHSKGIIATDITTNFMKAAATLQVGQLVKDDFFTLFESVGAIEIMDPKMDTGYLAAGETMDDDYDVTRTLLPEEVLGIMDQVLCFEMAWHMGHPLSQTLFTSLYIDHLLGGAHKATTHYPTFDKSTITAENDPLLLTLRAYCLATARTCWHINNRVKSEHYYEEEDFVTHTYNRDLLEDVQDDSVLDLLSQARDNLENVNTSRTNSEIFDGLLDRLNLRSSILKTVTAADMRSDEDSELINNWNKTEALAKALTRTQSFGKAVPSSFSSKVQRKLASTVPPRPIVIITFTEALEQLINLCKDGRKLTGVLDYHDSQSLMTFVLLFQAQKPQPSVYIRTLMQYYIFGDMVMLGRYSVRQILDQDLENMVLPADVLLDRLNDEIEVPTDHRHQIAEKMEIFRERAAQSYIDIFRTFCQNRSRVRRTLHHAITDWDNLQFDSEELDLQLQPLTQETPACDARFATESVYSFPLGSWAYYYKLRCMEYHLLLGFELEVYQPWEIAGIYWYYNYLCNTRIRHVERIKSFVTQRFTQHRKTSRKPDRMDSTFEHTLSFLNVCILEATASTNLASALSTLYTTLTRLDAIRYPPYEYSDPEIRYELRIKPFINITLPEPIPFVRFHNSVTCPTISTPQLLAVATESASRSKRDFELLSKLDVKTARYVGSTEAWSKNVKDCLRAVIMCNIGVASVKKAMEKSEEVKLKVDIPERGKGYHDWWVVPKVSIL